MRLTAPFEDAGNRIISIIIVIQAHIFLKRVFGGISFGSRIFVLLGLLWQTLCLVYEKYFSKTAFGTSKSPSMVNLHVMS